jgi:hypothetical protein
MPAMGGDEGFKKSGVEQVVSDAQSVLSDIKSFASSPVPENTPENVKQERFQKLFDSWQMLASFHATLQEYVQGNKLPTGYLDTYTQLAYGQINVDTQMRGLGMPFYAHFLRLKTDKLIEAAALRDDIDYGAFERRLIKEAVRNLATAIREDASPEDAIAVTRFLREFGSKL